MLCPKNNHSFAAADKKLSCSISYEIGEPVLQVCCKPLSHSDFRVIRSANVAPLPHPTPKNKVPRGLDRAPYFKGLHFVAVMETGENLAAHQSLISIISVSVLHGHHENKTRLVILMRKSWTYVHMFKTH